MAVFTAIALYRWSQSDFLFFALTALRDAGAVWFLVTRRPSSTLRRFGLNEVLAYASSALPLMYLNGTHDIAPISEAIINCLSIVGFTLATLALFELGTSFGVTPANRGVVRSGIYRYLRHPMYVGYVIAEVGLAVVNPFNWVILAISVSLYLLRARCESRLLVSEELKSTPAILPQSL